MKPGAFLLLAALLVVPQDRGRQRASAPEAFDCDRNNLTVYTSVVRNYQRRAGATTLQIHTDYDTTEQVTLSHPGTDDPPPMFRKQGEPFTAADWTRIESQRYAVIIASIRASCPAVNVSMHASSV